MKLDKLKQQLISKVTTVHSSNFEALALGIFQYQATYNPIYAQYLQLIRVNPAHVSSINAIPYFPIQFFKNYFIQTGIWSPTVIFESSGTTAQTTSRHLVYDMEFYLQNARHGFQHFYGAIENYCILALLPSYLERSSSSLVAMAADFISKSNYKQSGFFLNETEKLIEILLDVKNKNIPILLLGVSFALLELAEQYPMDLNSIIMMETGGMKGRRKELIRNELHNKLSQSFNLRNIHSEYGMTELFSQAYSSGNGIFAPSPTMRVFSRQITDPLSLERMGKTGVLNIIDLANVNTISFLATDDLCKVYADGTFEVLGRLSNADIRGCNLLVD